MMEPFLTEYWFLQAGQYMVSLPAELLALLVLEAELLHCCIGLRRIILQEGHFGAVRPEDIVVDFLLHCSLADTEPTGALLCFGKECLHQPAPPIFTSGAGVVVKSVPCAIIMNAFQPTHKPSS